MERSRWRHLDNTALALIRPLTDFSVSKQNRLVARVEGQSTIYSDDSNIVTLATPLSLTVIPTHQLQMPPEDPQHSLELEQKKMNELNGQ